MNYNSVLSVEKVQDIFNKLQPLNADFIKFGDFHFGVCIVSFKQKSGDFFKSGSILIDENGDVVSITNMKYNGLDCLQPRKKGSSLLQLEFIPDLNENPTKYIHYAIDIHEERGNKPYWHWEEGIIDVEDKYRLGYRSEIPINYKSIKGIEAVLWTEDYMCISHLDNEIRKYGVIVKTGNRWNELIKANFSYIDYKNGNIYTYDNNDISLGYGHIYEKDINPYEIIEENGKKKVIGTIIKSSDDLIRAGKYAGQKFSDIDSYTYYYNLLSILFITDEALINETILFRAFRDSTIINEELEVIRKDQIIDFCIPEFIDKNGNALNVNCYLEKISFEEAFLKYQLYVETLIKLNKLKIRESVFDVMLSEEYATKNISIRKRIMAAKIYNILSLSDIISLEDLVISETTETIDQLDIKQYGNVYIIPYNEEFGTQYAIINYKGEIMDNCTSVRYISDNIILYEKESLFPVWNEEKEYRLNSSENDQYFNNYWIKDEQGIIYKGDLIFKGDIGDLSLASVNSQYLLLEKPKFSQLEKDKIQYYLWHVLDDCDSCKCPKCGGEAFWDEDEDCYICEDCENHIIDNHRERGSWQLNKTQMLAADMFEDVLASEKVNHGQFITRTQEEKDMEEYWESTDEGQEWLESCTWEEPEKDYTEGQLYSLFSISKKSPIIPFQPCRIFVNPPGYKSGIYLIDEENEKGITEGISIKYEPQLQKGEWLMSRSYWNGQFYLTFHGTIFLSIFDTFRSGPLVGMTLSLAFKKEFRLLEKYLQGGFIYITNTAMKQLCQKYQEGCAPKVESVIACRDQYFKFNNIEDISDIIEGTAAYLGLVTVGRTDLFDRESWFDPIVEKSWYNGESFKDVLGKSPQYIIYLIKSNSLHVPRSILSKIDMSLSIYKDLENAIDAQERHIENEEKMDYGEPDYNDYERDAWFAMTDGQYGDMPEDFDGDYDFTGH